jgi:hypothetical protein
MSKIKSALEIALERTESVKSDKSSIEQFEIKQNGKRLANKFLEGGQAEMLEEAVRKTAKEMRASLKEGIFEVLVSRISLPVVKDDEKTIEAVGKGLQIIISDSKFISLYRELKKVLGQYLGEVAQYDEAIKRQYEPRLHQKEAELSKRMGQQVKIDPFQDPDFAAFYKQNMDALTENYQGAIDRVREEAAKAFELGNR